MVRWINGRRQTDKWRVTNRDECTDKSLEIEGQMNRLKG
jgi:hypothetical protein